MLRVFWIAFRVHVGRGIGFVSRALCGAFVTAVLGVVAVRPTIFGSFIAPDVVREFPEAESAGAVVAPRWLVAPSVPVYVGINTALAALVVIFVVILVLLWGLLLPLLPWLCRVHHQLLLQLVHRHRLLLDLVLLVAGGLLGARVTTRKFFDERLVMRVACWLVLNNLVGGVASVVLDAAHLYYDCADFPFEAGFHAPPYPCVCQCVVAWWECVPLFILRLEHSCLNNDGYQHVESVGGQDFCVRKHGVCDSVVESVIEDLPSVRDIPRLAHVVSVLINIRFVPYPKLFVEVGEGVPKGYVWVGNYGCIVTSPVFFGKDG